MGLRKSVSRLHSKYESKSSTSAWMTLALLTDPHSSDTSAHSRLLGEQHLCIMLGVQRPRQFPSCWTPKRINRNCLTTSVVLAIFVQSHGPIPALEPSERSLWARLYPGLCHSVKKNGIVESGWKQQSGTKNGKIGQDDKNKPITTTSQVVTSWATGEAAWVTVEERRLGG